MVSWLLKSAFFFLYPKGYRIENVVEVRVQNKTKQFNKIVKYYLKNKNK
jgi:hypothetical protein